MKTSQNCKKIDPPFGQEKQTKTPPQIHWKPLILEVHPSSTPLVVEHHELARNWGESGWVPLTEALSHVPRSQHHSTVCHLRYHETPLLRQHPPAPPLRPPLQAPRHNGDGQVENGHLMLPGKHQSIQPLWWLGNWSSDQIGLEKIPSHWDHPNIRKKWWGGRSWAREKMARKFIL